MNMRNLYKNLYVQLFCVPVAIIALACFLSSMDKCPQQLDRIEQKLDQLLETH